MLSIIIPSLNEEKYLGLLLESIKKQRFLNYEIILADAGSTDKTLEIAKQYSCKIITGGLPAKGRNEGAKIAMGDFLFFCDADVILPEDFFEKSLSEFKKRNLELASFGITFIPKNIIKTAIINIFYNYPVKLLETTLPHAATGILVKTDLFKKSGGFDEDIKLSEDHSLARYVQKQFKAKVGIIKSVNIFVSDRRFKTDGWFNIGLKYLFCELHLIFIGPVKSDIFKYKFGHYNNKPENKK
jgi:glycosyltransferase involved in cell wall biosynthesis